MEKNLRKVIPDALDLIPDAVPDRHSLPVFIALLIIGPAGRALGDGISYSEHADYPRGLAGWFAVRRALFGDCY